MQYIITDNYLSIVTVLKTVMNSVPHVHSETDLLRKERLGLLFLFYSKSVPTSPPFLKKLPV